MTDNNRLTINSMTEVPLKTRILQVEGCSGCWKNLTVPMVVAVFVVIYILIPSISATPHLISVVQIFRHGQRTPITFYPNDPYSDPAYWPEIPKELTNVGKAQHYDLGRYTRKRYIDVLPRAYSKKFIYAQTADVDRTHMSAQCNLLGLFPPTETELWNPDIAWSPIPVHSSTVLAKYHSCPAYNKEFDRVFVNETYYQKINATYANTYEYLSDNTGSNITSLSETLTLFDALSIEKEFGFALPSWTESVYPEPLTTMAGYIYQGFGFNTKLVRLGTGTFLNEVIEHFESMKKNSSSAQFFRMYSANDLHVIGVLSALGSFKPHAPSFASSIYIELWNSSETYYVNIYYKNKENLDKITPLGCSEFDCELGNLKKQLGGILLDISTLKAECAT